MEQLNLSKIGLMFCTILLTLFADEVLAYSEGSPNGHTGQPPDKATCALTRACHVGDVSIDAGVQIQIDGDPQVFVSGESYEMTVSVTDPIASCYGFQIGVQFEEDQSNAGRFILPSDAEGYENVNTGYYQYVEHIMPSTSGIWNFTWLAPGDKNGSSIIFYVAGIAANCDGDSVNDATYTASKKLDSECGGIIINKSVDQVAIDIECDFSQTTPRIALVIPSIEGGSGNYTIHPFGNSIASTETVGENESFIYYFTQNDIENDDVGFEVSDENGNRCGLDEETITGITEFAQFCNLPPCQSPIELDFQQGTVGRFNCDEDLNISVEVSDISGGSGFYFLNTLGFGTLSNETITVGQGFSFFFNLKEVGEQPIGFGVNDRSGCIAEFDFTNTIPFQALQEVCVRKCTSEIEITVVGSNEQPDVQCDASNPATPIYFIEIDSVFGGDGILQVEAESGTIVLNENDISQGFTYVFTQSTVSNEAATLIIDDGDLCSTVLDFNNYLSEIILEELCNCPQGCTNPQACNYNEDACEEDGSCILTGCNQGCTDACAPNYDPNADEDDGSCEFYDTTCNEDCNAGVVEVWNTAACTCVADLGAVEGCTDENASNYNVNATCDDGTCQYSGCTDPCAPNYEPNVNEDDGSCDAYEINCNEDCTEGDLEIWNIEICSCQVSETIITGCTNPNATNYNAAANCDDGSCTFPISNNCEARAGELRPIMFDTFCTSSVNLTLPVQFGYNINLEYLFLIATANLEIVTTTSDFTADISGTPAGEYCIYGMSYDPDNAPDLTVNNINDILAQSATCFSITTGCIPLTIQEQTINPLPPTSSIDTLFLCTGYTVPIDFCIDITDPDGGQAYLVDIISFCNPSIEGDTCVHYPPLPGLLVGDTEVISLIYCDDDCPQICDTTYAAISILDDCTNFQPPNPDSIGINCLPDTTYACVDPLMPIELCADCSYASTEYFINNIISDANATIQVQAGTCILYTATNESETTDSLTIELCSWESGSCTQKLFIIDIGGCDDEEVCPQIYACMPPVVEERICLSCEAAKYPNAVITDIKTKFDECVINLIDNMCFDYIPLPLMNILETDTAMITFCNEETNECNTTDIIITYQNCEGGVAQAVAANDYFEVYGNNQVELPVLANDNTNTIISLNLIENPANGSVFITDNQTINYQPSTDYLGTDRLIYEICEQGGDCYEAEVFLQIYPEHRSQFNNNNESLFKTYPNPADDFLTVEYNLKYKTNVEINIFNALGEQVYTFKKINYVGFYQHQINIIEFNSGIYIINVTLSAEKQSKKILVD